MGIVLLTLCAFSKYFVTVAKGTSVRLPRDGKAVRLASWKYKDMEMVENTSDLFTKIIREYFKEQDVNGNPIVRFQLVVRHTRLCNFNALCQVSKPYVAWRMSSGRKNNAFFWCLSRVFLRLTYVLSVRPSPAFRTEKPTKHFKK